MARAPSRTSSTKKQYRSRLKQIRVRIKSVVTRRASLIKQRSQLKRGDVSGRRRAAQNIFNLTSRIHQLRMDAYRLREAIKKLK